MSKKAGRYGDIASGHGCFPPTAVISGSSNVFINLRPSARLSDPVASHGCSSCKPHARNISAGSNSVFINGLPAARVSDAISCGGVVASGSPNVFIGDKAPDVEAPQAEKPLFALLQYRYITKSGRELKDIPYSYRSSSNENWREKHLKEDVTFSMGKTKIVSVEINEQVELYTAWPKFTFKKDDDNGTE
jgi:uncharacterized Zn-binding protein involved in type VI secretion